MGRDSKSHTLERSLNREMMDANSVQLGQVRFWEVARPRLSLEADIYEPTHPPQTHRLTCAHSPVCT